MSRELWARVSLRIASERLTPAEIAQVIGVASSSRSEKLWATDITADSATALQDQLLSVKRFLHEHLDGLASLRDADIGLCVSWTPNDPQDGIALDVDLIEMLSQIGCYVLVDTYSDR